MRTLSSMLIGMTMATGGVLVAGLTGNGWMLLFGILFFSLGEMLTGPKKNQYLGLIAPPGKKGIYLGYVNIPVGIGVFVGSWMAGVVYDSYGEKATLSLKYLATNRPVLVEAAPCADWSDSLDKVVELTGIDRDNALNIVAQHNNQTAEQAAQMLLTLYRYDQGQLTNLALQTLALTPQYQEKAQSSEELSVPITEASVASLVHQLPKAIHVERIAAFEVARDLMNQDQAEGKRING